MLFRSQPTEEGGEPPQVDENQIFLQATEGVQKQRVYGVGSSVSTYYASSLATTGATSSRQDMFPSQSAFDDAVERSVQSRIDVVRAELRSELQFELRREYEDQVSAFRCELETLMRWAHISGMQPPFPPSHTPPSDAEGDTGLDHTTDLGDQ